MAEKYAEFSPDAVEAALEAARRPFEGQSLQALAARPVPTGSEVSLFAECISVTVTNNQICLNLPLGFGSICIPIPLSIPDGTAASACLSICTTWGIPTGIKVSVIVAGVTIVQQTFGVC